MRLWVFSGGKERRDQSWEEIGLRWLACRCTMVSDVPHAAAPKAVSWIPALSNLVIRGQTLEAGPIEVLFEGSVHSV